MAEDDEFIVDIGDIAKRLNEVAIDLLVTVGLFCTVIEQYPLYVQENFRGKVNTITSELIRETGEFLDFGEAHDEEPS